MQGIAGRNVTVSIIYDVPDWAYHRRAMALCKYVQPPYIVRAYSWEDVKNGTADLATDVIFLLDWTLVNHIRARQAKQSALVASFNCTAQRREGMLRTLAAKVDAVIVNNLTGWLTRGNADNCTFIPNGVDTEVFRPTVPWSERPNRALWCSSASKHLAKGWRTLHFASERLAAHGFELECRIVSPSPRLNAQQMVEWYNSGRYILSVAPPDYEATPNTISEGVACGCVAVSTRGGNIMQWGDDCNNCVFIEPDSVKDLLGGVRRAKRAGRRMSVAGREQIETRYGYHNTAPAFFEVFEQAIARRKKWRNHPMGR